MKNAILFAVLAILFLFLLLYCLDLLLFLRKLRKQQESGALTVPFLEQAHKKARHPQKKNYYFYTLCRLSLSQGDEEKALRLAPFIKSDPILGANRDFIQ